MDGKAATHPASFHLHPRAVRKALRSMKRKKGDEAKAIAKMVKDLAGSLAFSTIELEA